MMVSISRNWLNFFIGLILRYYYDSIDELGRERIIFGDYYMEG
jgi:hypothetical protein